MLPASADGNRFAHCLSVLPWLFLTLLRTWPVALELGILRSFAQNWEFLAKSCVEIGVEQTCPYKNSISIPYGKVTLRILKDMLRKNIS